MNNAYYSFACDLASVVYENMQYPKIQNKIRQIEKYTGYLIQKFKEKKQKTLYYIKTYILGETRK